MIRLVRRTSLLVAFCMLTAVTTAFAECAWVLWNGGYGTLLVADWTSGTLFRWSAKTGMQTLASGFKGPADFRVVPDLVKGELRMVRLAR